MAKERRKQTVRMRVLPMTGWWLWQSWSGSWRDDEELTVCKSPGGCKRSGNAWARRMGYTPEWE